MTDDQNVPIKCVDIFAMYKDELARAEAAEAEVGRLRAELAAMPRPEDRCNGEWPCEASTALAFAEAEMARAEARAEAAEAEAARSARFLGECGYLVGIEVYSPDDIPVILDRLGDLHIRAEAAGAARERAAVVAWLREKANAEHPIERGVPSLSPVGRGLLLFHADHIERGAHIGAAGGAR